MMPKTARRLGITLVMLSVLFVGVAMMASAQWLARFVDGRLPQIQHVHGGCGEVTHFATYKDTAFYQLTCWGKVTPSITAEPIDTVPRDPFADLDSLKARRQQHLKHGQERKSPPDINHEEPYARS